jgi:hypothetical protein
MLFKLAIDVLPANYMPHKAFSWSYGALMTGQAHDFRAPRASVVLDYPEVTGTPRAAESSLADHMIVWLKINWILTFETLEYVSDVSVIFSLCEQQV